MRTFDMWSEKARAVKAGAAKKAEGLKEGADAQTDGEQDPDTGGDEDQSAREILEAKTDDELLALAIDQGIEETDRAAIIEKLLEKAEE